MAQKNIILEPDWGFNIGKLPQFEMRHIEVREGRLYVLGVAHSSIKLGDRFTKLSRYTPQENVQDCLGEDVMSLKLKVISITAYHNQLNRINADMTAGIECIGSWDGLLKTLNQLSWVTDDNNSHQWRDTVANSEKLILTK